jgi:CelD/BcsL family acetyltransferase involved in cellulose biosynthesis
MRTTSDTSTRSEHAAFANARPTGRATLRTVPFAELSARDLGAWSDLAARAAEPNPFYEPEALVPAAAFHGGIDLGMVEAGGELLAALPLRPARRWRRVPYPALHVWRHDDCYLGSPLIAPEAPAEAIGGLLDGAGQRLIAFEWVGTGGPVEAAIQAATAERGITPIAYERFDRAALQRRPDPTYLQDKVSKGRARELRRLRRQLSELLGGPLEVHERSGDPEAIEGYLRAEAASWKAGAGTHFLHSPEYAEFFRAVCDRFAAAGRLQLLVLSCGGTDVAWKVNFVTADRVFCFKIAYDPTFGRFSPGVQLELEFVDLFHGTEFAASDSCAAPDNAMINRLWPDRRELVTLLVPGAGMRGAAARHGVRTVMAARRMIRRTNDQAA